MKLLVNGISGFMGREVARLATEGYRGSSLSLGVDLVSGAYDTAPIYAGFDGVPEDAPIDCIIDFSHHSATPALLEFAISRKIPVVVATTGHDDREIEYIRRAGEVIPVFHSANMSLGVALLVGLARTAALAMPDADIEIVEKHHTRKLDAPSGTALMLADAIIEARPDAFVNCGRSGHGKRDKNEIGIHALRLGNVVGEHEVILATGTETITLKHEAHSRALFAEGAIAAADFLLGMRAGLYNMQSLIDGTSASIASV